ncbi:MAG: alpha/beta hydrolase fold domain-containing protein [Gemmatimonadaceae bacterium]|nr:alpha/beta hydrolase fold domain-containing protein [Gemmatimonadaceae bacterium]
MKSSPTLITFAATLVLAPLPLHARTNTPVSYTQDVLPLWDGVAPGALGTAPADVPTMAVYRATGDRATGAAAVIFPGGGYQHLATEKEGVKVAQWLNGQGVTAFVVTYRLGPRYQHPIMEQDGQRAVRLVRARAARYGINPSRIAVVGFSAGGHLAGTVATRGTSGNSTASDPVERMSARPDAAILVYPVVTMQAPHAHTGSRTNLLGVQPLPAVLREMSLETQVSTQTPPTFLVASTEDRSVPVENSLALYSALRAAQVPVELHVYERGRHGFGLAPDDAVLSTWTGHAADWLSRTLREPRIATTPTADTTTHAVVDARHRGANGDSVRGVPVYRTINAAVAAAPNFPLTPYLIRIRAGRYAEKISVDKPNIRMVGAGRDSTVITWSDIAGTPAPGGGTLGTRGSWTLRATQPDFRLEHLTVENAFDYNSNARKANEDTTKIRDAQGLALALTDRSDRAVLNDVVLLGHQDTFFADAGRTYVTRSRIDGNVDFIFGAGRVVFDDCDIISLDRGSTSNNGYIAAPSTDVSTYGMLFIRSRLKKASPSMAPNTVSLGRPWHPGGNPRAVGMAIFVDTWMDDHISSKGWDRMSAGPTANGERIWFEPQHARFAEYGSKGPGAVASPSRRVLSDGDALTYSIDLVLDGWKPGVTR